MVLKIELCIKIMFLKEERLTDQKSIYSEKQIDR